MAEAPDDTALSTYSKTATSAIIDRLEARRRRSFVVLRDVFERRPGWTQAQCRDRRGGDENVDEARRNALATSSNICENEAELPEAVEWRWSLQRQPGLALGRSRAPASTETLEEVHLRADAEHVNDLRYASGRSRIWR